MQPVYAGNQVIALGGHPVQERCRYEFDTGNVFIYGLEAIHQVDSGELKQVLLAVLLKVSGRLNQGVALSTAQIEPGGMAVCSYFGSQVSFGFELELLLVAVDSTGVSFPIHAGVGNGGRPDELGFGKEVHVGNDMVSTKEQFGLMLPLLKVSQKHQKSQSELFYYIFLMIN